MRTRIMFSLAVFVVTLVAPLAIQADILSNTFDGNTAGNTDPFSTGQVADGNISSPGVTRPGHTLNGGSDALVAGELRTSGANINAGTRYFGFSITPENGATVNFDDFVYSGSVTLNDGTVLPTKFGFRSSIDGFTNNIGTATLGGATIDLSGADFQNITSQIEFRLYTQIDTDFSADGSSSGTTYNLNEFFFNGTVVAVPEPSSLVVLAAGICFVSCRRRKTQA